MYPPSDQQLAYETADTVFFFSHAFDPLNNWSAHQVQLWGNTFPTTEHGFHYRKFDEIKPELAAQILAAPSPFIALELAKQYKNRRRADWDTIKIDIMTELVRAKANQHEDVRDCLLATGTKRIVENSPWDDFWGIGQEGTGDNHMGKILMLVRNELQKEDV